MLSTLKELVWLLGHVVRHPNNKRQRLRATLRFFHWQLHKRLWKTPLTVSVGSNRLFKVICDSYFSSLVIYNRLPDWDEMNFLLRLLRPADGFVDIGANVGFYTVLASTLVTEGPILSVEANPKNVTILREQVQLNGLSNVTVLPFALGNVAGEVAFSDSSRETGSLADGSESDGRLIKDPCQTLDAALGGLALPAWTVAKMDVEGCEEMILQGGRDTLAQNRISVWLFELADAGLKRHRSSAEQLVRLFNEHGYSICYWDEKTQRLGGRGDEADTDRANYIACRDAGQLGQRLRASKQ